MKETTTVIKMHCFCCPDAEIKYRDRKEKNHTTKGGKGLVAQIKKKVKK